MSTITTHQAEPHSLSRTVVTCWPAASSADLAAHHAIRRTVFIGEQAVFTDDDRDEHDEATGVIHLLARYGGEPAGAVRLFPIGAAGDLWQGDRLCVLAQHRTHRIGAPLVRCAVACAGARGGKGMVAHVQLPNVRFFVRLGWQADGGTELYAGLEHQRMIIELPARDAGELVERQMAAGLPG